MISASAVSKRYPEGLQALSDVSFEIDAGEMVFITGHSGAGKSTLFRLLAAIERPTSGSIVVNGQNLAALSKSAIPYLRRNFGQNALAQVKAFDKAINVTGLVVTKLDGTAKGGVIAAIARQCPKPIRFIGVGEGIDDLRPFVARDFVDAIFE